LETAAEIGVAKRLAVAALRIDAGLDRGAELAGDQGDRRGARVPNDNVRAA